MSESETLAPRQLGPALCIEDSIVICVLDIQEGVEQGGKEEGGREIQRENGQ